MVHAIGYAAKSKTSLLKSFEFLRKNLTAQDVQIDIQYCGVCHSDVHQARNEWHNTQYPCVPGHEIVGVVEKVGRGVKKFKVGDLVGVGCMIDSCGKCQPCKDGEENLCEKGALATYNGNMRKPTDHENTYGGYSNKIVVNQNFVLTIPKKIAPESAGPILCAGVTTYSPLKHWNVGKGTKVGVVGIGGLGHMAIKLANAMGAEVTAITAHKNKTKDALGFGAKHVLLSTDKNAMKKAESTLDFILSTIPQSHDVNPYCELLKNDGVLTIVGCIAPTSKPVDLSKMLMSRRVLATSIIGGIAETQEVLDFCAKHDIAPDTKLINIQDINEAFDQIDQGDVDYRFVIDMSSLESEHESKSMLKTLGIVGRKESQQH